MEGDVTLIVRRKTSMVCIGVDLGIPADVSGETRFRLQRCYRRTSPMIRLLMGIWQHEISVTSRGGLSQASPASSFDAEARAAWHDGMAACNRQRVLRCAVMTPDVGHGVSLRQ